MTRTAWTRRQWLQVSAAGAALGCLPGCSRHMGAAEPQSPVEFKPGQPLPWINWAGNQSCTPSLRAAPASEDELVALLRKAPGVVRAVGAGHSFSAVVPTQDSLISMDLLSGVIAHDPAAQQADIWAGTRVSKLGPLLDAVGQALPNQPDLNYLSLGGAVANAVHATGQRFGNMSSYCVGLTLATPGGELLECSASQHPEVFQAARTSVGALGLVTRLKMQNQAAFRLTETNRVEKTEDVLDDIEHRLARHRHFEMLPLLHSPLAITVSTDLAAPGDVELGEDDPGALNTLKTVYETVGWLPGIGETAYEKILMAAVGGSGSTVRVGPSFQVFPHVREVRFREMEYTVPAEAGPACLREILRTIRERNMPVCFPLEFRYCKGDDIWLSLLEGLGERGGCAISVHQFGDVDYRPYFEQIEPIFWKYQGRPHWGKIHTLDAKRLAALYPRHWKDFHEVRRALDPRGRMMNKHLHQIFGA
ncbi:MAG: FAD-binding protein [Burkholderiaceae bacterium]|nr:FAD-binding protein [Burkholderiaceae bacterium]